jgi:hypothetical protein
LGRGISGAQVAVEPVEGCNAGTMETLFYLKMPEHSLTEKESEK